MLQRQGETNAEVTSVDHPSSAGEPPEHRYAFYATPLEVGLLRFLGVTQYYDRSLPRRQEQRDPSIGRTIQQPGLACEVLYRRARGPVDIESGFPAHAWD
jgi:hypothetical protein